MHLYSNEGEKIHFLQCLRIREWYHKSLDSIPRMIPLEDASNLHANVYINLRIVDWQLLTCLTANISLALTASPTQSK